MLGGRPAPTNLFLAWEWNLLSQEDGGINQFEQFLTAHPDCRLSWWTLWKPLSLTQARRNQDAYQAFYSWGKTIRRWAMDKNLALLFVHHTNKASWEDPFSAISGANSVAGTMNSKMIFKAATPGVSDGNFVLTAKGNEFGQKEIALTMDEASLNFRFEGDARQIYMSQERSTIIEALQQSGPQSPKEIADALGESRATIRKRLQRMIFDKQVIKVGNDKYSLSNSVRMGVTDVTPDTGITDVTPVTDPDDLSVEDEIPVTPVTPVTADPPVTPVTPIYADFCKSISNCVDFHELIELEEKIIDSGVFSSLQRVNLRAEIKQARARLNLSV
jgi:hypothetical protein